MMHRRGFLLSAVAGGAFATVAGAHAREVLEGEATRTPAGDVHLAWTAPNLPISIFVSTDPDALAASMRELKTGVREGRADLQVPISPRPYFLLTAPGGEQVRVAERQLPLKGARNFRDLGGYRAEDGRQVRWGRMYRSNVMSALTVADKAYLSGLGIQVICDLRNTQERKTAPSPFVGTAGPQVIVAADYEQPPPVGLDSAKTRAEAISILADTYVQFTSVLAPHYTDMFAQLLRRETPLAFNCTAGKDRAGMAAALILSVLGVPRETVIADYALSQVYAPPPVLPPPGATAPAGPPGSTADRLAAIARMPPEVQAIVLGADPALMRQALAQIDQKYGGPVELAKSRLGLTDAKIADLRRVYLI